MTGPPDRRRVENRNGWRRRHVHTEIDDLMRRALSASATAAKVCGAGWRLPVLLRAA
jgi:hypothetical protein